MQSFGDATKDRIISPRLTSLTLIGGADCLSGSPCLTPDLMVKGGARIRKNLCVNGNIYVNNLCVRNDLTVKGNEIINGNLTVHGDEIIDGNLFVGDLINATDIFISHNALINNDLCVVGNLLVDSIFPKILGGDITLDGNVVITNDLCVIGNLLVDTILPKTSGNITLDGNVVVITNDLCVIGNLLVDTILPKTSGNITFGGNLIVTGNIVSNTPPPVATALGFAHFYALMPGDNAATVGLGAAVEFPQLGATSVTVDTPTAITSSTFDLPTIGTYEIYFQVAIDEPGQLVLRLNGSLVAFSVAGRATGTSQISNYVLLTTSSPNSVLEVVNPPGNAAALTITPIAGGAEAVSATLLIKKLA